VKKFILFIACLWMLTLTAAAQVKNYYVSPSGKDSNNGTSAGTAWLTIAHAESALTLGSSGTCTATNGWYSESNVGACVHVLAGNYPAPTSTCLADSMPHTVCGTRNGTPGTRIVFLSDTYRAAILNGKFVERGDNVSVVGFTITCPSCDAAIWFGFGANSVGSSNLGFNNSARYNYIHDTAQTYNGGNKVFFGCPTAGAIYTGYAPNGIVIDGNQIDHFAATTRDPGGQACHESHGIYVSGPRNRITNNVISRSAGFAVHLYHNTCQEVVSNNTVFNNYGGGLDISSGSSNDGQGDPVYCGNLNQWTAVNNNLAINNGADWGFHGIREFSARNANNTYNNNLLIGNQPNDGILQNNCSSSCSDGPLPSSTSFSSNLCGVSGTISNACTGSTAATTASLFGNYTGTASGNYQLISGSPAIGAGTSGKCAASGQTSCIPATDFASLARSLPPSTGAYEFASSAGSAPGAPTGLTALVQ
jgi:Right handed beta helix region